MSIEVHFFDIKRSDFMKYLKNDGEIFEGDYDVKVARHTASHILAQAVKRLYKDAKLAIGPAIDTGFYYDFDNLSLNSSF